MPQKIAVIGANGQLGTDIVRELESTYAIIPLTHDDIDICNRESVKNLFERETSLFCVINTAAYHNVEVCESNPEKSFFVNAIGARNLALSCNENDTHLVHISTDYVFGGNVYAKHPEIEKKPFTENDAPDPVNVYGISKLAGEHAILAVCGESSILRVSGLYGTNPCRAKGGDNFVEKLIRNATERPELRYVANEFVSPTPTKAVARQIRTILENPVYGVIHATCEGFCSWYEFAKTILEYAGLKTPIYPVESAPDPTKVKRPFWSVLENAVLKEKKINIMPDWKDGLSEYLKETKRIFYV